MSKEDELTRIKNEINDSLKANEEYFESREMITQFAFLVLWRPVELMLDYIDYNKSTLEGEAYWKSRNRMGVDAKCDLAGKEGLNEITMNQLHELRDYRNAMIHGYHPKKDYSMKALETYESMCNSLIQCCGISVYHTELISYGGKRFKVIHFGNEDDYNAVELKDRIMRDYKYVTKLLKKDSKEDNGIKVYLMESLLQSLVYYGLIHHNGYKIDIIGKGDPRAEKQRPGIYIGKDDSSLRWTPSYIDFIIGEEGKVDGITPRFTELEAYKVLRDIRTLRNKIVHYRNPDDEVFSEFRNIWYHALYLCAYDFPVIYKDANYKFNKNKYLTELNYLERFIKSSDKLEKLRFVGSLSNTLGVLLNMIDEFSTIKNNKDPQNEDDENKLLYMMEREYDKLYKNQVKEKQRKYMDMTINKLGSIAGRLDDQTIQYISTGYMLKDTLNELSNDDVDYAGVTLEFTKALEYYLYERIAKKYYDYSAYGGFNNMSKELRRDFENKRITLGSYAKIFADRPQNGNESSKPFINFCKSNKIYKASNKKELEQVLDNESNILLKVKDQYRNPSAHKDKIPKEVMSECIHELVDGEETVFYRFTEDLS